MSIVINDITPLDQFIATNLQTVFNVTWTAELTTDVVVYARATGTTANDINDIIAPADYTVAFIGGTLAVRVTFAVGRTTGDIVTITRDTTAQRANLYVNTNFTPTMLNSDFALSTFIQQQNEMAINTFGPRYNKSATLEPTVLSGAPNPGNIDRIMPILGVEKGWIKNAAGTAIVTTTIPEIGAAPLDATYITQTPDTYLTNEQALSLLGTGIMVSTTATGVVNTRILTGTASEIDVVNGNGAGGNPTVGITDNPTVPGTAGMQIPTGTTAQRVVPVSPAINLRYNTDLVQVEYYDHSTSTWIGFCPDTLLPVTDHAIARFNGTTGQIQNSGVIIDDANAVTGITQLDVDNVRIDGNTISVTDTNGDLNLAANGTGDIRTNGSGLICGDPGFEASGIDIGGVIYESLLKVSDIGTANAAQMIVHRHSTTLEPLLIGARTNSDTSAHAVVTNGQALFSLYGVGWDGTQYSLGAQIVMEVDGTPGVADMPGRLVFKTTPDGSAVPVEAMRITNDGKLGLSVTAPTHDLDLVGDVQFNYTATSTDSHAFELNCDAAGLGGVSAFDIFYTTGAQAAGTEEAAILVNVDDTASVGGEVFGLEVLTTPGAATVYGMRAGALVNPLEQLTGTFANADTILNKAVDVTAALASGGAGSITTFVADNDTFTIGAAAKFEEISFELDTGASGSGIAATFEFSIGIGTWTSFVPTDGTNGFRNTGVLAWDAADVLTWATGTGGEYLIRITRTRNSLATTPIIDVVQIAAVAEYGWDKDAYLTIKQALLDADPTLPLEAATKQYVDGSASTGITWSEVTGTTQAVAVNNGYILNNAGLITATLPVTAAIGNTFLFQGKGAGLYKIAQNAGQTIHFGSTDTTTGVGGSITATNQYDSIELVCITANTDFAVFTGPQGNFTIV